jgi:hypothetical protein
MFLKGLFSRENYSSNPDGSAAETSPEFDDMTLGEHVTFRGFYEIVAEIEYTYILSYSVTFSSPKYVWKQSYGWGMGR